ncbi:MAG TPA: hypothetical protein VJI46_01295 [Candidatus Nanoarchaeia archaeon]|nr:hypothetical protein [Candidatus Nanoarchaeia archaeon]
MRRVILVLALISLVILVGCAKKSVEIQKPAAENPVIAEKPISEPAVQLPSCSSVGGDVCGAGESCIGELLEASDSFSCCSQQCTAREQKSFSTFDFGQENPAVGSIGK